MKLTKEKKPFYKRTWFIVLMVLFGLSVIGAGASEEEVRKDVAKVEAKEEEVKKGVVKDKTPLPVDKRITKFINKELGKKTNTDDPRIREVKYNEIALQIFMNADTSLTEKMTKNQMLNRAKEVFEELKKYDDMKLPVAISFNLDLVDAYGAVKSEEVLRVRLSHGTLQKIEYGKFDAKNLEAISDEYFEHLLFSK